jgi:hypothetical protein
MIAYRRTTRECSVSQLDPRLLQAFGEYFSKHELGDPTAVTLMCCETFSERENPGIFDTLLSGNPDTTDYLGLILTDQSLLWTRAGDRSKTKVFGANLKNIRVKAYASRITKETGLQISGFIGDPVDRVKGNLALGPEEAARKFCEEARMAVEKVNPTAKKRKIPWFNL